MSRRSCHEAAKRALDVVGGVAALLAFSPVLLVAAILIKRDGGPVLYVQQRMGRNGRSFGMLKLRTMVPNADKMEAFVRRAQAGGYGVPGTYNDPRVTRIGAILRLLNLDEAPQLINVLRGEMSLVGPRPVPYEESLLYGRHRDEVLSVQPGITGYWQIKRRMDMTYDERTRLDTHYVRNRSVLLDAYILLLTPVSMLTSDYNSVTKPLPPRTDGCLTDTRAMNPPMLEPAEKRRAA